MDRFRPFQGVPRLSPQFQPGQSLAHTSPKPREAPPNTEGSFEGLLAAAAAAAPFPALPLCYGLGRKLRAWWQKRKRSGKAKVLEEEEGTERDICPWEVDYQLLLCEGLFSEYLEMGEWTRPPVRQALLGHRSGGRSNKPVGTRSAQSLDLDST